ncbi:nitronate monooxygenase family protein [Bradyrhizobium sp. SSUT112]|uniref:NAD(P)H-dependent flavin oxidoreductase n=1 Tax=Bradyrhizobium sp. SSUT112 TaxID=3040604 RepID=UPI00244C19E9|nr:nitronate monooxygenase family protein [Bradyrhizobium sp. SSUT112]MDH2357050.1 nitronate monooxygenase family protein [Bradyrhizobium sp. SSUT112]
MLRTSRGEGTSDVGPIASDLNACFALSNRCGHRRVFRGAGSSPLDLLGDPTPFVAQAHAAGVKVIDQVGSVADAQRAARAGVDAIVAQGVEAGGHLADEITTMALVPRVVDAVAPVAVIAAGGIADARGFAATLALGAQGVMIGTRLIATTEAYAHPHYKQNVIDATEDRTVRTTLFGHGWPNAPHRTLRTPFVEHWLPDEGRGSEQRADEPQIGATKIGGRSTPLLRFMGFPPMPDAVGDLDSMDFLAGQGVGLVNAIKPAADVVHELVDGAQQLVFQLARSIQTPDE